MNRNEDWKKFNLVIGFVASIIAIFVFITGIENMQEWINSSSHTIPAQTSTTIPIAKKYPNAPISKEYDSLEGNDSVNKNLTIFLVEYGIDSSLLIEPVLSVSDSGYSVSSDYIDGFLNDAIQGYYDAFSGQISIVEYSNHVDWKDEVEVKQIANDYDVDVIIFTEIFLKSDVPFERYIHGQWITRVSLAATGKLIWIGHCEF